MMIDCGIMAPPANPVMMREGLNKIEAHSETTAMVGDRYFRDIVGARDAGLFTIYIDIHSEPPSTNLRGPQKTCQSHIPCLCCDATRPRAFSHYAPDKAPRGVMYQIKDPLVSWLPQTAT